MLKRVQMTSSDLVQKLAERTDECGLIQAIYELIGNGVEVAIGFSAETCAMTIDEINFSGRTMNGLHRAGVFTIGDVIEAISTNNLVRMWTIGKRSRSEIKTELLVLGFEQLTPADKLIFFEDLVARNTFSG